MKRHVSHAPGTVFWFYAGAVVIRQSRTLLERQGEAAALEGARDAAARGDGVALSVEGPAGIGKTTLLEYAAEGAREDGFTVLSARGAEVEMGYAFGIVQTLFGRYLGGLDDDARAATLEGTSDTVASLFGASPERVAAAGTDGLAGAVHGLFWLTANVADTAGPLAIVVDDAHWADHASMRWIEFLARRVDGLPVLLIAGARNDELHAPYSTPAGATRITPAPLSGDGARALLEHRLDEHVERGFADATRRVTGGNPLLIEQLAAAIAERGWKPTDDRAGSLDDFGPPETADFTLARLDRMGEEAIALAEAVAVLGPAVTLDLCAELSGLDRAAVARTADALADGGLFSSDRPLAFVHPIVEAAARNSIPRNRQGLMHRKAADLLLARGASPARVAQHLIETEPNDDAEVVRLLRDAAAEAAGRGAMDVAVAALSRARQEPPSPAEAGTVALELGRVRLALGDPSAEELLREAIDTSSDPIVRAKAALALGPTLLLGDRLEQAERVLEDALAVLGDSDVELATEIEIELLSAGHLKMVDHGRWHERVQRLTRGQVSAPLRRAALGHLAQHAAFDGYPPAQVRALALEALAEGRLLKEVTSDGPAYYFAASALVMSEDFAMSRDALTAAREEAERRGSPVGFALASAFRALPNLRLGDLDAAEADSLEALAVSTEHENSLSLPGAVIWLMENLTTRGRFDEADRLLDGFGFQGELPSYTWFLHLYEKRGALRLAQGRLEEALADLREAGRRNYAVGDRHVTDVFWRSYLAQVFMGLDRPDEARAIAEEEAKLARHFTGEYTTGRALIGLAATYPDGDEALRMLTDARNFAAAKSAPVLEAQAAVAGGAMLRRLGRKSEARELLRVALDLAAPRGMAPVESWAREELSAAGARARVRPTSGMAALTPSELRIARLAAAGSSNRSIARSLFVTEKTVETHLTAVYAKLEIASRRDLPDVLNGAS